MPQKAGSQCWGLGQRRTVDFALVLVLSTLGCATENSGGSGGAGGISGAVGGQGGNGIAPTAESTHDSRWDPPEGLSSQVQAPPSNATTCTLNSQCQTGYCVDGFCCDVACDNICMACAAAKKGGGADGVCGSVAYDTDPDNECADGSCDGKNVCKRYNGVACTSTAQCLSNYCVDGFCCGNICMGACQACSTAKKGSGYNGVCGNIAPATDPDNECTAGDCNGSGSCTTMQTTAANGTACTSAAQCASGYCAEGVCCDSWCLGACQACTAAKKGNGTDGTCGPIKYDTDPDEECWGGSCDGNGTCKKYNGLWCTGTSECLSGYCVDGFCCGNICTGMCYACSTTKKGQGYDGVCGPVVSGKDSEDECNPGECNGSGMCNQPQTPQANGTTCASGSQCASGNCIDGYCCNTSCTASCQACSAAKKGSGANGVCGNIASETDPENECNGGKCDGAGACRFYNGASCTSTSQCFSKYCVDGVCCGNVCTGLCMACSTAKKGSGYNGVCGLVAANIDPDNECSPGECNGSGACNAPQGNGKSCTLGTQCVSGFCVDGVCCASACNGTCQACTAAKKGSGIDGICGHIAKETDPDNECSGGRCDGVGLCRFYNGAPCTTTTQCFSNYCADGFCCGNVCTTSCMACSTAKKGSGYNGVCGPVAANTDPDDECAVTCNGSGACQKLPNGSPCMSGLECTGGYCINGSCCDASCTMCNPGFHPCGDHCASDSSITECGMACMTCPVPPDAIAATCINASCGFSCKPGFQQVGSTCSALPPRPIGPLSGSIVTSKNPTLRWVLPAGVSGAQVKVCADRACTNVRWSGNVTGTSVSTGNLPTGVSYWQLFGIGSAGAGTIASATWEMVVLGAPNALSSGSWGPIGDYNGDGYADAFNTPGGDHLTVYDGSSSGLASLPARTFLAGNIFFSTISGDVNGDGFVDLISSVDHLYIGIFYGSLSGLPPSGYNSAAQVNLMNFDPLGTGDLNGDGYADLVSGNRQTQVKIAYGATNGLGSASTTITSPDSSNSFAQYRSAAVGDLNLDGYADLVISSPDAASNVGVAYLYLGSSSGLPASPSVIINNPTGEPNNFGSEVTMAGDVNGDGHPDIYIGVRAGSGCSVCNKGFLFYGAPGGLGSNTIILSPGSATDAFGTNANPAGDVNADGYSDLLIASDNTAARFYVFLGGASGIATSPATTVSAGWLHNGLLGDTNGDGFSDVLASDSNQLLVLRGTAAGLSTTPAQTIFF